jgi:hypothetical protein
MTNATCRFYQPAAQSATWMIDSISNAAQDRAQDTPGAAITLAQGFPSLRCERSRRPTRPESPPCIHAEYGINHLDHSAS